MISRGPALAACLRREGGERDPMVELGTNNEWLLAQSERCAKPVFF